MLCFYRRMRNANGKYLAHLPVELRNQIDKEIGKGYSKNTTAYIAPTKFIKTIKTIKNHRILNRKPQ